MFQLGCFLCIFGTTIIIINSPKQEEVLNLSELIEKFSNSLFIYYVILVAIVSITIGFYFGPKYGHKYVIIYILLCSAMGSLTVMACKGLGLAIREYLSTSATVFNVKILLLLLLFVISCILVQMNYLNKALDLFNTNIVTPVYYVFFTTLVLIASAILFKEWQNLTLRDMSGCVSGFLIVIVAIFFLTTYKNMDITLCDRSKQEIVNKNGFKAKYGTLYA